MTRAAALSLFVALALCAGAPRASAEGTRSPCARGSRYKGPAIDLDVKDADLHNVFRFLADAGGVNIVVPDEVKGSVTLRLRHVPWEQVLCTIVRVKKLVVDAEGSIYSVSAP